MQINPARGEHPFPHPPPDTHPNQGRLGSDIKSGVPTGRETRQAGVLFTFQYSGSCVYSVVAAVRDVL